MPRKKIRHRIVDVFARRLKGLRAERRLTQIKLAMKANLHLSYLGRLERGDASPSIDTVGQLADAFGIDAAELLRSDAVWSESLEPLRQQLKETTDRAIKLADRATLQALALVSASVMKG